MHDGARRDPGDPGAGNTAWPEGPGALALVTVFTFHPFRNDRRPFGSPRQQAALADSSHLDCGVPRCAFAYLGAVLLLAGPWLRASAVGGPGQCVAGAPGRRQRIGRPTGPRGGPTGPRGRGQRRPLRGERRLPHRPVRGRRLLRIGLHRHLRRLQRRRQRGPLPAGARQPGPRQRVRRRTGHQLRPRRRLRRQGRLPQVPPKAWSAPRAAARPTPSAPPAPATAWGTAGRARAVPAPPRSASGTSAARAAWMTPSARRATSATPAPAAASGCRRRPAIATASARPASAWTASAATTACAGQMPGLQQPRLGRHLHAGRPTAADPRRECLVQGVFTCGNAGGCDGQGACKLHVAGAPCGFGSCEGSTVYGPSTCDGKGPCKRGPASDCDPYVCNGMSCWTACATNDQCKSGRTCNINVGDGGVEVQGARRARRTGRRTSRQAGRSAAAGQLLESTAWLMKARCSAVYGMPVAAAVAISPRRPAPSAARRSADDGPPGSGLGSWASIRCPAGRRRRSAGEERGVGIDVGVGELAGRTPRCTTAWRTGWCRGAAGPRRPAGCSARRRPQASVRATAGSPAPRPGRSVGLGDSARSAPSHSVVQVRPPRTPAPCSSASTAHRFQGRRVARYLRSSGPAGVAAWSFPRAA